jgi:hypothetical protein
MMSYYQKNGRGKNMQLYGNNLWENADTTGAMDASGVPVTQFNYLGREMETMRKERSSNHAHP